MMRKRSGRIEVSIADDGVKHHEYSHGVELVFYLHEASKSPDGERFSISVEEARDLHYMLSRIIAKASGEVR